MMRLYVFVFLSPGVSRYELNHCALEMSDKSKMTMLGD